MIGIIHYLRKSIIFFSVPAALLSACSGADDLAVNEPHEQSPKASSSQVKAPTANPVSYTALQISNIDPESLMPPLEIGDKNVYKHIEHLRFPESTIIRDMMWEYGAGSNSKEEYQELMSRLNTGMLGEIPLTYNNYEIVGGKFISAPSEHAFIERFILSNAIKYANFVIINTSNHREDLYTLCQKDKNKINILGLSSGAMVDKDQYTAWHEEVAKEYDKQKNWLVFCSAGNVKERDGVLNNKLYQENYTLPDKHSKYGERSRAHNKNDINLDRHLCITIATNKNGDINQTEEKGESSLFPVGFHDKILFSGRILPYKRNPDGEFGAPGGKYNTSFTNYVNVVLADLCFQMKADVKDVDELLDMIRSTALTDYIRFDLNGDGDTDDVVDGQPESQPLQLINPAGFIKKYLMPENLPTELSINETKELSKGSYMGVVFNILGAEVLIDGEWTACTEQNATKIKAQNPFSLEWRLNGGLCQQYGKKTGDVIEGTIILVDDQWNGLSITLPFSVTLTDTSTGIRPVYAD